MGTIYQIFAVERNVRVIINLVDALVELFDLQVDPAETTNVIDQNAEIAKKLQGELREWQGSVLHSLTGADYQKLAD